MRESWHKSSVMSLPEELVDQEMQLLAPHPFWTGWAQQVIFLGWLQCFELPSVFCRCWLGDMKGTWHVESRCQLCRVVFFWNRQRKRIKAAAE